MKARYIYEIYKVTSQSRDRVAIMLTAAKAVRYIKEHLPFDDTTVAVFRGTTKPCIQTSSYDNVFKTKDITRFRFCGKVIEGGYYTYGYEVDKVEIK